MGSRKGLTGALLVAALGIMALMLPGIAAAKDRNHDNIPDRWEKQHSLSLKVNQAHRDQDRDKLVNIQEFKAGDNPRKADTNGDGTSDGEENAGTIASFDGTTLTINLFNGGSVSGLVTDATQIQCDGSNDQGDDDQGDDSGGSGGGDKAGATSQASDDDQGDDDQGDDDQGDDDGGDGGQTCTTADLVPDAVVSQADLSLSGGNATFEEVDLAGTTGTN
ncbi:MAG: hypothetical protein QOI00_59 [Chloroflexota bacterium]|jgi:hypothetical protein|nr:hypothetical protein [Chloroflexota bacterium]